MYSNFYSHEPWYQNAYPMHPMYHNWQYYNWQPHMGAYWQASENRPTYVLKDYGPEPLVVNIEEITEQNSNFRTALWTGKHLQVTLMSINRGEDIGLEVHPNTDQFIRIEEGNALVQMGPTKDNLNIRMDVDDDFAIMIPAGTWHNVTNTGHRPLKLYSIYAPPRHPRGTVHETKAIAMSEND